LLMIASNSFLRTGFCIILLYIIKGNSKLLNLYSKVLNTYIGNYSIHKTATAIPDFQQTGIGRFLLLFRSFEQSLYAISE
jgi:hypothetical protein